MFMVCNLRSVLAVSGRPGSACPLPAHRFFRGMKRHAAFRTQIVENANTSGFFIHRSMNFIQRSMKVDRARPFLKRVSAQWISAGSNRFPRGLMDFCQT